MKIFRSAHLRNHSGVKDRNAFGLARWTFLNAVGAQCQDPRRPIDAIVANDRLRLKRNIAREWLSRRDAERAQAAPQRAPETNQTRRLCRVLAFHTKRR